MLMNTDLPVDVNTDEVYLIHGSMKYDIDGFLSPLAIERFQLEIAVSSH